MRSGSIILAAFLAIVAARADAQSRYLFVDMRGDGAYAQFIDLNSIRREERKFDYWVLQVNLAPTATRPRFISHFLRRYSEDCVASTSRMTYSIAYTASGEPLTRGPVNAEAGPIVPDTVGEELHDLLCQGQAPSFSTVSNAEEARAFARSLLPKLKQRR